MAQAVFRQEEKDFKARLGSIVRLCVTRGEGERGKGLEGRRGAEGGGKVFIWLWQQMLSNSSRFHQRPLEACEHVVGCVDQVPVH